jgi:MFS family permease
MYYGWVVVLLCFLALCVNFGIRLSFGIFFEALTRSGEFGWTRADTAGVFSLSVLVQAATSAGIGLLLDRLGARIVYLAGLLLIAGGMWLTSRMQSLSEFYLAFGLVTGLGSAILGLSVHGTTVSRWFGPDRRRGLAIGMAYAGTGIGILALAPVLESTIAIAGWRSAYLLLGSLALVLVPFTLLFLRGSPPLPLEVTRQITTSGTTTSRRPASTSTDWVTFWLIMVAGVTSLFTLRMITVHQVAHFVDQGIERATAAAIFGWSGLITALSYTGFGLLSDRIGRERSFYLGGVAQLIALAMLVGLQPGMPAAYLYTYAILWGIGEGSRSGLLTAIASDRFSGPNLGTIVGSLGAFFGLGAALGSWSGGVIFDTAGSYLPAFGLAIGATIVAIVCVRRIATP